MSRASASSSDSGGSTSTSTGPAAGSRMTQRMTGRDAEQLLQRLPELVLALLDLRHPERPIRREHQLERLPVERRRRRDLQERRKHRLALTPQVLDHRRPAPPQHRHIHGRSARPEHRSDRRFLTGWGRGLLGLSPASWCLRRRRRRRERPRPRAVACALVAARGARGGGRGLLWSGADRGWSGRRRWRRRGTRGRRRHPGALCRNTGDAFETF